MNPTLPEEAVKAMPERIYASAPSSSSGCVVSFDVPSLAYDVEYVRADLAIPHLPGVGVKKLAWIRPPLSDTLSRCDTDFGTYRTWTHDEANGKWFWSVEGGGDEANGEALNEEAAKAAAQADYDARILSALEPSAARKLALEEAFKAGAEWADECGSGESPYLEIAAKEYAIRALGTSCEQLNKAVSNVPDQQENEPGAHGERERVLEESLSETRTDLVILQGTVAHAAKTDRRWEGMYERVGSWIKRIDATLSSPDHNADADKLVEGDGWLPIDSAPKDGTEVLGFDALTKIMHVTFCNQGYWHDPDSHYYSEAPNFNPTHWRPLPSVPSQEVAG